MFRSSTVTALKDAEIAESKCFQLNADDNRGQLKKLIWLQEWHLYKNLFRCVQSKLCCRNLMELVFFAPSLTNTL